MEPKVSSTATVNESKRRETVQECIRRANATAYRQLDAMIERALPQSRAMTLACLRLMLANNGAGDYVAKRLKESIEAYIAKTGEADENEPDVVITREWMALLAGLTHGYQDSLE